MFRKLLPYIVILVLGIIVLAPPVAHGYVYPNVSDDSAEHLKLIEQIEMNNIIPDGARYLGISIIGLPLKLISNLGIDLNNSFMWFNYLALIGIGISIYFVLTRLVNRKAALVSIPIVMFCCASVICLFEHGIIFNLINMGIILPFAIYFAVKWLAHNKTVYLLSAIAFMGLFSIFHTTSVYLTFFIACSLFIGTIFNIKSRNWKPILKSLILVSVAITINLLSMEFVIGNNSQNVMNEATTHLTNGVGYAVTAPPTIPEFIIIYLSPLVTVLFLISLILIYKNRDKLNIKGMGLETRLFLLILGSITLCLVVASFTSISYDPTRVAFDLAIIISILTSALIGIAISKSDSKVIHHSIVAAVIIGCFPVLSLWFGYNSAIKPVDMEAIEYINSQSNSKYTCSSQVAHWIYDRYIEKEFTDDINDAEYIIYRSKHMTPRTDANNYWFGSNKESNVSDFSEFKIIKKFYDSELEIVIFRGDK